MKMRRAWCAPLCVAIAGVFFVPAAASLRAQQDPQPWIHVAVSGENAEDFSLNLPLAALEAAMALMSESIVQNGQVQLGNELELPVSAIRGVWQELREVGAAESTAIQYQGQDVRIAREGETVLVATGGSPGVRIEIPVPVVDALLSGDDDKLDFPAAVQALSSLRGDVVRVVEVGSNIRVWIDESPVQ